MAQKPRILFLITDLNLGGSPLMLANLAAGLAARFDVHVCSLASLPIDNPVVPNRLRAAGVPIHSLNLQSVSAKNATAGIVAYRKLLDDLKPDLVYSILIHANALATLGKQGGAKHKLIHAIHTLQPEPRWHWTLQGAIANSADAVFAPSKAILDRIAEFGPYQRGVVIPNGIDVAHFANATPLYPLLPANSPSRPVVLGFVGRFDPVKRIDLLISAVAELRKLGHSVAAHIVGYGDQLHLLEKLATSLQVAPNVYFAGPTDDPAGWYKSFDIHVLPSPVEGFGLTLVESLAAGTPVVAIHTPVTAQIVRNAVDGVLVPSPTAESLIAGIQEVISWRTSHRWDPNPSRLWVEQHFSLQAMISAHIKNLEKILRD